MNRLRTVTQAQSRYTVKELLRRRIKAKAFVPKTVVILTDTHVESINDNLPPLNEEYLTRFELLPEHLLYLTVEIHHEPEMKENRFSTVPIDIDPSTGTILSVQINYGFMEEIDLKKELKTLREMYPMALHKEMDEWVFHVLHPKLFATKSFYSFKRKVEYTIFKILYRNSMRTEDFLGLNHTHHITAEVVPVRMK